MGMWMRIASGLCLAGIVCILLGGFIKVKPLVYVGLALGAPLVLGGVLSVVAGVPWALYVRSKESPPSMKTLMHWDHPDSRNKVSEKSSAADDANTRSGTRP